MAIEFAGGINAGGGVYEEEDGRAYISDSQAYKAECAPVDNPAGIVYDEFRGWVQEDGRGIEWR